MEMPEAFAENCAEHYMKAVEKHPHFADRLFYNENVRAARSNLTMRRRILKLLKNSCSEAVLRCEISEAAYSSAQGDKAHAIDELYDAVAVIMRMIAVLEDKQKLGGSK